MADAVQAVRSILVVGGGSSGWMAAAYLSKILPGVSVTLVESPGTPVIGVGEATIPFIRSFLERLGFASDKSWMPHCDATFKTGILFENWHAPGDTYWHPFEYLDYLDRHTHTGHCWLHLRARGHPAFADKGSFYRAFFPSTTLNVQHNRIPAPGVGYAYHFDAGLFGELLRNAAPEVQHIRDDVLGVRLDEGGAIDALVTAAGGELHADLYLDCTGFRGRLIREVAPQQPFISFAESLFCDRAVVLRLPYETDRPLEEQIHSYARATAQEAGWIWSIPLYSKLSRGYVYASAFTSDEEAELTLRRFCGEKRASGLNSLKLSFRSGRLENLWVKNCVAIGLAGGFIEPLESTGLAVTQIGVEMLASMLDGRFYEPRLVARYNAHLEKFYNDILQFIIPHYCLTAREDSPFWRAVRHETRIPADLAARLETFRQYLPTTSTKALAEVWMFRDISWFAVLLGMAFDFERAAVDDGAVRWLKDLMAGKRRAVEDNLQRLPNHYHYLRDELYAA